MSDKDLFEQAQNPAQPADPAGGAQAPQPEAKPATPESELIGEGKKYKSLDDAINSIAPAQEHIGKLEAENAELRKRLLGLEEKMASADDVLSKVRQQSETKTTDSVTNAALSPEEVAKLVDQAISTRTTEEKAKANLDQFQSALMDKYGEKAAEMLTQGAQELGMPLEEIQALAKKSASAAAKLFGLDNAPRMAPGNTPASSVNTQALQQKSTATEGTYAWYKEQKAVRGTDWYSSASVQRKMLADAERLGREKFFSK